jgi:hypothetical protein
VGLTITNIVNAYRKSGLKPERNSFCGDGTSKKCGCALTALYCSQHKVHPVDRAEKTGDFVDDLITDWAVNRYGDNFTNGLIFGFDDFQGNYESEVANYKEEQRRAYWLGRKAFKELKKYYKGLK